MDSRIEEMLAEDSRRRRAFAERRRHDPLRGTDEPGRCLVDTPEPGVPRAYVPATMLADPGYALARGDAGAWARLRCRHDFEYWCLRCVTIKHKTEGADVPFRLNMPQRKVLAVLESDRLAGRPIRAIILKARQWGGSTLVQVYMAWIQSCHRRNWHSLICAHVKDTAAGIRGMYTKLLANYPENLWDGDEKPQFRPYERAQNVREISGRGCRVTIGSSENQEAVRGADYSMAHLSETAFWPSTLTRTPGRFIRAVCGAIALIPYSLIVMESTANGVGNYFHSEWIRCKEGRGDKHAVFVPWYEIEMNRAAVADPAALAASLDDYETGLWNLGLDLEQICWYRLKSREYPGAEELHAEYPTTDVEAFANTGNGVFAAAAIEALREGCSRLRAETGDVGLGGGGFVPDATGGMSVWRRPQPGFSYIAAVDVGGRSRSSDWSVVVVLRLPEVEGMLPEVVAQWRGHCDHDILARRAAAIAGYYNEALLVVESNTFETAEYGGADSNLFILSRLADSYPNVYRREVFDTLGARTGWRVGFHTNRSTKSMLIATMIEAVREGGYIERCSGACDELATYEQLPNGSYAAKSGYHDDMLMARAIALHVAGGCQCRAERADASPRVSLW